MEIDNLEIPKEITKTMYVILDLRYSGSDNISIYDYDRASLYDEDELVLLTKKKITIKIPKQKIDIRGELIKGLEKKRTKTLARHHMELSNIDDKLGQLKAITYQPED